MKDKTNIFALKVEITDLSEGCWTYKISKINATTFNVAGLSFEGWFSFVFDPLPALKRWLEAIALGVEQTSFTYCPEGTDLRFSFGRAMCTERTDIEFPRYVGHHVDLFEIHYVKDINYREFEGEYGTRWITPITPGECLFRVETDRKQLVSAFYLGLIDFFNSDKYNPKEWERFRRHRGTPLRKFRSEIIEKYLNEK